MDLLATHKVPLFRTVNDSGYLDEDNIWVEASELPEETLYCNIQPFRNGLLKNILPDGVRTDGSIFVRTRTKLQRADHFFGTKSDEIIFDNTRYELTYEELWSGFGLATDHYKYLFTRKDKVND